MSAKRLEQVGRQKDAELAQAQIEALEQRTRDAESRRASLEESLAALAARSDACRAEIEAIRKAKTDSRAEIEAKEAEIRKATEQRLSCQQTETEALARARTAADSREEGIDMLMKLDSLKTVVDLNRAYIDNLSNVLDRNRIPTDSIDMGKPVAPLPPESLMDAGDAERNFVANISSQNNYRTSALASLAADGVTFHPLTMAGIQTQSSMESREAVIVVPGSDPVLAPADGRVIDIYYSSLNGYSVMLQHPRGFVSRIRGLGRILVNEGDYLSVGDAVGMGPGQKRRHSSITLRLWHNGTPLLPADYIRQPNQKLNSK